MIVFLVLLGIYGLTKVFSGKKDQSFDANLIQIDTTQVTRLIINPKAPDETEISLTKEGAGWIASNGNLNHILHSFDLHTIACDSISVDIDPHEISSRESLDAIRINHGG